MEKRKRRELVIDGLAEGGEVEEATPSKTVSKARHRKCRKRRTKETARKCIRKLVKRISYAELVLGCIKPSLEERKYLLDPRHIGCVDLSVNIAPETPSNTKMIFPFLNDTCHSFSNSLIVNLCSKKYECHSLIVSL